jgi:phosphonate transport system substrate-binding protein
VKIDRVRFLWSAGLLALCLSAASAMRVAPSVAAPDPRPFEGPKVLRFTGIPNNNTTELEAKYKPLAKYLTDKLGVPVEYVPSADYNASVDGFTNGDILLCWFGGLTGVQAREKIKGARVIACGKVDPEFHSYFIANKSLGLEKSTSFPLGLKGKKFTFGSQNSTSGRLMPEYFIRKFTKLSPKEFFGMEMSFSGAHDKTAALVQAGTFDAGAIDYKTYDRLVAEHKKDPAKGVDPDVCRIVWVTPNYPDYHFCAHPAIDETFGKGFTDKLQAALIEIKDPELLKGMDRTEGLIAAKNEDFDALRTVVVELGLVR